MSRTISFALDLDTVFTVYALTQYSHPEASAIVLLVGVAVALFFALVEV